MLNNANRSEIIKKQEQKKAKNKNNENKENNLLENHLIILKIGLKIFFF